MLEKIVSGGQTGVDRAALDVAIHLNISFGGWCPYGRIDELGLIPEKYDLLKEVSSTLATEKENYDMRTRLNIVDSDGTLIILPALPISENIKDGTLHTINEVTVQNKPFLLIGLESGEDVNISKLTEWVANNDIGVLNIAGPRESTCEGIYYLTFSFLEKVFPILINSISLSL